MNVSSIQPQSSYSENLKKLSNLNHLAGKLYSSNPLNKRAFCFFINIDDLRSLFKSLEGFGVKYLLVGNVAGVVYGHITAVLNLSLWVKNERENTKALVKALFENDVAGSNLYLNMPLIFGYTSVRFGMSGFELDLGHSLKAFSEADFDTCYERALKADLDGIPFPVIQLRDLITEKEATGRRKDLADIEELHRIWEEQQL